MKFWKNWPYWVKGGGIGFVISLICFPIIPFLVRITALLLWLTGVILNNPVNGRLVSKLASYSPIIGLFFITIIGVIVGWTYGKIKNRKSVS